MKFPADAKTMKKKLKPRTWTQQQDDAYDRKHGIKEGSKADQRLDASRGLKKKKITKKKFNYHKQTPKKAKSNKK